MRIPVVRCLSYWGFQALLLAWAAQGAEAFDPTEVDPSFQAEAVVSGTVKAIVIQPDGKLLIGGSFALNDPVLRFNVGVARLEADGQLDQTFEPTLDQVQTLAIQPDGKVLVAGSHYLQRLNLDGSQDPTFNPALVSAPRFAVTTAFELLADGRIVLGSGGARRLNANGEGDPSFQIPMDISSINALRVLPDGGIAVSAVKDHGAVAGHGMFKLSQNGSLESHLEASAALCMTLDPGGKLILGGYSGLSRLTARGTRDPTFAGVAVGGRQQQVWSLAVQADGKILFGGSFENVDGYPRPFLGRLETDSELDLGFDTSSLFDRSTLIDAGVYALVLDDQQRILVGGLLPPSNGRAVPPILRLRGGASPKAPPGIARLPVSQRVPMGATVVLETLVSGYPNPKLQWSRNEVPIAGETNRALTLTNLGLDNHGAYTLHVTNSEGHARAQAVIDVGLFNQPGSLDLDFQPCQAPECGSDELIGVLRGGKIVILRGAPLATAAVLLLNTDGTLDKVLASSELFPEFDSIVRSHLAEQADGRFILDIQYTAETGLLSRVIRLLPDGDPDREFAASDLAGDVNAVAIAPSGFVYLGGPSVRRLRPDGALDSSFVVQMPFSVAACAVQQDEHILIGGFSSPGSGDNCLVRLSPDGNLDSSFQPSVCDVRKILPQPDGKILLSARTVVRLLPTGAADPNFQPALVDGGNVYDLALQSDGKILLGGTGLGSRGSGRGPVARWNSDGSYDSSFAPNGQIDSYVRRLAVQSDQFVIIQGGYVWRVNDVPRLALSRLNLASAALPADSASPKLATPARTTAGWISAIQTTSTGSYRLERATRLRPPDWGTVEAFRGDGYHWTVHLPVSEESDSSFFRVAVDQPAPE